MEVSDISDEESNSTIRKRKISMDLESEDEEITKNLLRNVIVQKQEDKERAKKRLARELRQSQEMSQGLISILTLS
jgi:hypothetical protein